MLVACWNIEKNGASSEYAKQSKVSDFIDECLKTIEVDILFICEVHSSQVKNFTEFFAKVYGDYENFSVKGGYSNNYILLTKKKSEVQWLGEESLKGLNRYVVYLGCGGITLGLAHFKSGQTELTASQLAACGEVLEKFNAGSWFMAGDLNWDYSKRDELKVPAGTKAYTYWQDQTQAKGGILDWALYGQYVTVNDYALVAKFRSKSEIWDMKGPDHKPVIYSISRAASNASGGGTKM